MNKLSISILIILLTSCGASANNEEKTKNHADTNTEATITIEEEVPLTSTDTPDLETTPTPEPKKNKEIRHCYLRVEGENKTDTNFVRLVITGDEVKGKYIVTYQGGITRGDLKGSKKGNIITANWTFVNGTDFYSIPVSFKMKRFTLFQKPTAVKEGKAYVPEEGDYDVKYDEIDCGTAN